MHPVFQEIIEIARNKFEQAFGQEPEAQPQEAWDPDAWEEEVRQFTCQLGHLALERRAQKEAEKAQAQARFCPCGQRRHLRKRKAFWWSTTYGRVAVEDIYLVCPKGDSTARPFAHRSGLRCRGKSKALRRVLSDFGAEKSFAKARKQLKEHYGVELPGESIRRVVEEEARRVQGYLSQRWEEVVAEYQQGKRGRKGASWLIVESDGSMVRTGKLVPAPRGGLRKNGQPKRERESAWREVRLSTVEVAGEAGRLYGAVLGSPEEVGRQMFALALLAGWGEESRVHGLGDGALWIAPLIQGVFPGSGYLLDRYHLLEHLYLGAQGLPKGYPLSAREWVEEQVSQIDQGGVEEVVTCCQSLGGDGENPLGDLARYLHNQREHLDYAAAREQGLPVGSGAVEGGHRHVIQERLKLPGTWWKEENVNPMLALRTLRANGWWEAFWN